MAVIFELKKQQIFFFKRKEFAMRWIWKFQSIIKFQSSHQKMESWLIIPLKTPVELNT